MEDQTRQQPLAAATQKLRELFSTRGPSTAQVLTVVILFLLGGVLLLLAGLTLAGTLIVLAVTAPLFALFSPVLIPAAVTIGLAVTGYLTSVAFGVTALFFFSWMVKSLRTRMRERHTISGGKDEEVGPSSSTSAERSDSGPSAPVDIKKGKSAIFVNQQQQTIPGGQNEDAGASNSLTSPERSDSGPSASLTSVIGNNYYVFLSFRGPDTRNGFIDHLYHRLRDVGLRFHPNFVFRDDSDLPFGEDIAENLISAITHSKVSIPVISPNYASSEWCLRELIHIIECKESRGQIVLPVLYKVKPKDVRHLGGTFGNAFKSRMHRFEEDVKQKGPVALRKAVDSRIFESEEFAYGREAVLVNKLVEIVMREQQEDFQPRPHVNLVGIDDHVAEVMKLVDTACADTRIIGIYGIGGIGKTTLAMAIYKELSDQFHCRSFLMDIRETINHGGIKHVQSLLISDILKIHDYQVHDSHKGIQIIQSSCTGKQVLIVLDDVDRQDYLNMLIGDCSFAIGSRIIITCRDKAMLKSKYGYELEEMNREDSLLLFSKCAFEGEPPPKALATLSREIVATTGGLPLALTVVGSLLKTEQEQRVWRDMLKKLRKAPNTKVQQKLKISYETLEYEEQQMFLDIACLFIGTDQRIATYMWDDLNLFPTTGLAKLIERSLIKYDDNKLRMHDQLRDLGKAISRPAGKKPSDCSRLWDEEEAMTILQSKDANENVEFLRLDKDGSSMFMEQESFKRLPYLKFLHVKEVDFAGDFEESLSELRWLKWTRCPGSFGVAHIHLEKLLILDLSGGKICENWGGWSSIKMERLRVLNLSWCSDLKSTPNLSAFGKLEMLILENCQNLAEIDHSIQDVKCLVSLNLRYCESLKKLPKELGELTELEELLMDGTNIKEIPPCIGSLKKLKRISAVGCQSEIPSSIGHLVNFW